MARGRSGLPAESGADEPSEPAQVKRRSRDRSRSEAALLEAAWALLKRDGVLGGINLMAVAEEAEVNRSLIYRYFGSREALLQAALRWRNDSTAAEFEQGRQLPFATRRAHAWEQVLQDPTYGQVLAHLALSDDAEFRLMPFIDRTREALEHDHETGALPKSVDGPAAHALSVATYLGYSVFRTALARELGVDVEELDRRATVVFNQMMSGLASNAGEPTTDT